MQSAVRFFLIFSLILLGIFAARLILGKTGNKQSIDIAYDTIAPDLGNFPIDGKFNVLLFSKTNGYRHTRAIPAAKKMFTDFADEEDWNLFKTENAAIHNAQDIARFDLLIWNNVTGDVLNTAQRAAFKTYLEGGGQLLALHATGGNETYLWPWFGNTVIKAQFTAHPMKPQFQNGVLVVENTAHPATRHLPKRWARMDEWYSFAQSPRKDVEVLLSLDESSYSPSRYGGNLDLSMGGDHPIVWHHKVGEGRVFYAAIGHLPEAYEEQNFRSLIKHACIWLLE